MQAADDVRRGLNHVELVYRPGERQLAKDVLELLGCRPVDRGGEWFTAFVDPDEGDWSNNVLYASEVTPEQWTFEQSLRRSSEWDGYAARLEREPQRAAHFGIRVAGESELDGLVDRISGAGTEGPLAGRIQVSGVYRPGDPGAATDTMIQAFVRTDVIASGLLALGQHVELQCQLT